MTQKELAEISGVDYKHIQLLESKNPSAAKIDTLEKIAKILKISLNNYTPHTLRVESLSPPQNNNIST